MAIGLARNVVQNQQVCGIEAGRGLHHGASFATRVSPADSRQRTSSPSSGYQPTHDPAMEVYVRTPEEVGWEYFDLKGCVPVRLL